MSEKRPVGVTVFGILLLATSLMQLQTLFVLGLTGYYEILFSSLPYGFLEARYFILLALGILGLTLGVGLFSRREIFRKAAIFLACFMIAAVLFQHPFLSVQKHTARVIAVLAARSGICGGFDNPVVVSKAVFASYLLRILVDLFFALLLLRYFTNPKVEKWFRR